MEFQGAGETSIHQTQISVSAALLNQGVPLDKVVALLLNATRRAAGAVGASWNWKQEERELRKMCATWLKKLKAEAEEEEAATANSASSWPQPKPIPKGLLPVASFDPATLLPAAIAPWVADIADRMQCPPDFVGLSALTALASVLGRKVAIRPKREDDWIRVSNLWSMIVGRPGILKSPAMDEVLKPLNRLEAAARMPYGGRKLAQTPDAEIRGRRKGSDLVHRKNPAAN